MKKALSLLFCGVSLCGCANASTHFLVFANKLGVEMPTMYDKVFSASESAIDQSMYYDIYQITDDWTLKYTDQYVTEFKDDFDLSSYIDKINTHRAFNVPEEHYIPKDASLDWVCRRGKDTVRDARNGEWLLIFDKETKLLYALESYHQLTTALLA